MTSLLHGQPTRTRQTSPSQDPQTSDADQELEWESAGILDSQGLASFSVSVVIHTIFLMVLAIFVYGSQSEEVSQTEPLHTILEPPPEVAITESEIQLAEHLNASDNQDSSKMLENSQALANASSEPPAVDVTALTHRGLMPSTNPQSGSGFGGDELAGLGESVGAGTVAGDGSREKGEGEVGFFGAKAKGKSFVFIVDCSGSMTTPTMTYSPRLNGPINRFQRARQELYLSLGQLSEEQSYYIIFYNNETYPMFFPRNANAMVPATSEFLGPTRTWIQNVVPGGGTEPQDAMQLALALRPEVIFFLTDGAIPPATRLIAKGNNKSRTRIHTIAFGLQKDHAIMKGIAADNQGRFKFVP